MDDWLGWSTPRPKLRALSRLSRPAKDISEASLDSRGGGPEDIFVSLSLEYDQEHSFDLRPQLLGLVGGA